MINLDTSNQQRLSYPHTLLKVLQQLRHNVVREGNHQYEKWRSLITRNAFIPSAQNLAYYLALRRHDMREIQLALTPWGLSSLGRIEPRVLPNLDGVIATLGALCGQDPTFLPKHPPLQAFFEGDRLLQYHTDELFGHPPNNRNVRIMVTLPSYAATDDHFILDLVKRGADCLRINCAHDSQLEWEAMIQHIRDAEKSTGKRCKIFMDLGGPKLRLQTVIAPQGQKRIYQGEGLLLSRENPTKPHKTHFQASLSLPEVLEQVKVGATIWIDDGHVGGKVESVGNEGVLIRITHARPNGEKIRVDKGINFPDTPLDLSPLTDKDRQDLDFIVTHADMIGYSFVQKANDIEMLQWELEQRLGTDWRKVAIVAKIETLTAVKNLPELIIHGAGKQPFGVMIARGDLAVEIGYQRLAEMQEEILWLCQAAHVPVIWATQVLENLVKKSIPSRAEMTDAAMAERAECVMLNKGDYIVEAVGILDEVLCRMQAHQLKKTPQLRALHSW
ncbi:pyruvate kinase [Crocosphaera subtropica ATCC 51142]|uniref:Pyruvate kinase n=1 Tax=Crocosphaera subtropica (strain ATCC 51142 / BH68) TaxID=43989 RepID=B1WQD0_CROS5|nr:pyruvate kinase [Crocosphaera subtropica]ACB50052.1 pyruvate kinase [Crocosphaera subtropica ATCC 51142]